MTLSERVRRFYDEYHEHRDRPVDDWMREHYWREFRGAALEVGGGTRLPRLDSYTLVDFSPTAVTKAVARGVSACLADAMALPFRDRSFDTVACNDVLEHAVDPELVLSEMARVTRSRIVVAGPNYVGDEYHGGADRYVPRRVLRYLRGARRSWRRIETHHLIFDGGWSPDRDAIAAVNAGWVVWQLRRLGLRGLRGETWRAPWRFLNRLPVFRYVGPDMFVVAERCD